ncbi:MAG: hypothetical protein H6772_04935 [Pseudomonadales bacterium]|nr:hypothetical protein [Pseudomonadales bacterium]
MIIKKLMFLASLICIMLLHSVSEVSAFEFSKLGVHILNVSELKDAKDLVIPISTDILGVNSQEILPTVYEDWNYVTVPITFDDIEDHKELDWQLFFDNAKTMKVIPIVRLTTKYSLEDKAWVVPNKKQIITQLDFLSKLNWPTEQRNIIVFNEVNHAAEWGGKVNPQEYTQILKFVSNWAHTEGKNYVVLPAAMDLAVPNSSISFEAFNYLNQMYAEDPEIFSYVDIWNSHSYPNPGFISSPTKYGKNSLRGFEYELDYLKAKTGEEYKVMITETGWMETKATSRWLSSYYTYAMQHIWSDDRVVAVTPFLLKGAPGPFAGFSFYDENDQPTNQFHAFKAALQKISEIDFPKVSYKN